MPRKRHLERDVKADIKKLLDEHAWFWFSPAANAFGKSGVSDILAIRDGMFIATEVKRGAGAPKPTANQIAFLQTVKAHKFFAFVVNEARLPHLKAFLEALDRSILAARKREQPAPEDGAMMLNAIRELQTEI
jgi:Holliday junction resolvase